MHVSSREICDNGGENSSEVNTLISMALTTCIEILEAETSGYRNLQNLKLEQIERDNKLVQLRIYRVHFII